MYKTKVVAFVVLMAMSVLFMRECAVSEKSIDIKFGTIEGSVYENEYLGIGCQLDRWHFYSIEELGKINTFVTMDQLPHDLRSDIQEQGNMMLMFAETPDKALSVNISVSYDQDAEFQATLFGMEKTVSMLHNQMMYSLHQRWGENVFLAKDRSR